MGRSDLDWNRPAWAPDSKKVAFVADAERDGDSALQVAWVGPSPRASKVSQPFAADRDLGDFMGADSTHLPQLAESRSGDAEQLKRVDTAASPPKGQTPSAPLMGTIVRVVADPLNRSVLYANGVPMDWMDWCWQDWKGSALRMVDGSVDWSWGLYAPLFSAERALLFTTQGDDWSRRSGAEHYWSAMGLADAANLIQGRASGGVSCGMYAPAGRRFWRNEGRRLAYLNTCGDLHLVDTASGSRRQAQVLAAPQVGVITDLSWPQGYYLRFAGRRVRNRCLSVSALNVTSAGS
jgi:hypothetical protein